MAEQDRFRRECEFCTNEAAVLCEDVVCRGAGLGELHDESCPAAETGDMQSCDCIPPDVEL